MSTTRRRFVLGGVGALSAAVLGDAFLIEPSAIDVSRHDVPVPGLPPGLEGVRIACLTDVHLAGGVSAAARVALEVLARERPDVVVLIGDICNEWSDLPTLVAWALGAHCADRSRHGRAGLRSGGGGAALQLGRTGLCPRRDAQRGGYRRPGERKARPCGGAERRADGRLRGVGATRSGLRGRHRA